jgi:hypothetical protein
MLSFGMGAIDCSDGEALPSTTLTGSTQPARNGYRGRCDAKVVALIVWGPEE